MTPTLLFCIVLAALMTVVAVINKLNSRRLQDDMAAVLFKLKKAEKENASLKTELARLTRQRGIGESTVLSLAGEIARMENNLRHMDDVPGRRQVLRALERMKGAFLAEDYYIVPLLGHSYVNGMNATVVFVPDESLEVGASVIQSVQKPQVNYQGKMIQSASITVGQNM